MKRLTLMLILALAPSAANIHTIATISGSGAKVQISTDSQTRAKWIQVIADSGNSAKVFFGDSTVSATTGLPIAAGAGYNTPACQSCVYTLSATYVYVGSGDKVYVAFGD